MVTTAIATPATEELNGLLEKQATPSLISINVIAAQLQVEPKSVLEFCQRKGYFIAPVYDGGEYMLDFNAVTPDFVRGFAYENIAKSIEPAVQAGIDAITALRNGTATPSEIDSSKWKMPIAVKPMKKMVKNVLAEVDPTGEKNLLKLMEDDHPAAVAYVNRLIEKRFNNSTTAKAAFYRAVKQYAKAVAIAVATEANGETSTETKTERKAPGRKKKTEQAAA